MRVLSSSNLGAARASFAIACVRRTLVLAAGLALLSGGVSCSAWQQDDQSGAQSGSSADDSRVAAGATRFEYEDSVGGTLFSVDASAAALPANAAGTQPVAIKVSRQAALDSAQRGTMAVELPDGTRYPVRYESSKSAPGGNWTFVGRVDTSMGALASVITFGKDSVFGTLPTPDGRMMQVTTVAGQAMLQPAGGIIPPGLFPDSAPTDVVMPPKPAKAASAQPGTRSPAVVNPRGLVRMKGEPGPAIRLPDVMRTSRAPVAGARAPLFAPTPVAASMEVAIDVLGLYTTNLATVRGSTAAAETEFTNMVAVANQAHVDSGSVVRLNLVGLRETDYPEDAYNTDALADLQMNQVPDALDVHQLRDELGADLVAMLRPYAPGDTSCGIAYVNGSGLAAATPNAGYGFSVSATVDCGPLVMAHEVGHNLGSMHDAETSMGALGAFDYSYGYRRFDPGIATVMAYTQSGQSWLGFFSHPGTSLCNGVECGIDGEADNVRSFAQMAPRIARFRDPWNTISIFAGSAVEGETDIENLQFFVRSSSPAPAGGITFDVAGLPGGTATPDVDFAATSTTATGLTIPEGSREIAIHARILPDAAVEGDETLLVGITNVVGMPVYQSEAVLTILDDDPRAMLSGRVLFPGGSTPPDEPFWIWIDANLDGFLEPMGGPVPPPDYDYEASIPSGSRVTMFVDLPPPFLPVSVDLGRIEGDTVHDIEANSGNLLSGRVTWPEGATAPTAPIYVIAWDAVTPGYGVGTYAEAPDYEYEFVARTDANVSLTADTPPAPWVTQDLEVGFIDGDVVADIELRMVPSLTIRHLAVEEGASGSTADHVVDVVLSAPAPPGGISFEVATADGTAVSGPPEAGGDYEAIEWVELGISEGARSVSGMVSVHGDDIAEDDETFQIITSNVAAGAWFPGPATVHILDDDVGGQGVAPSDFDGDGQSDLLWRNQQYGQNVAWFGADAETPLALLGVRDLGWQVVAIGDFDGDGQAGVFWRHAITGANAIWRSGHYDDQLPVVGVSSPAWEVVAVGDFNGNGTSDVFWRNSASGANVIWESGNYATPIAVRTVGSAAWQVAGAGDFDGDGRADVLWRNQLIGANVIWAGADATSTMVTGGLPDLAWGVAGIGDIDGDGEADILWRNGTTGANLAWRSADPSLAQVLGSVVDTAWQIRGVGDYNGDGRTDLIWRNGTTGANVAWAGADRSQGVALVGVRDLAWQIVP